MTVPMGLFDLDLPTDDAYPASQYLAVVADAFHKIDYPWARLIPGLRARGFSRIRVEWAYNDGLPGGSIGVYYGSEARMVLSKQYGPSGTDFTFAHECGHAVDYHTFSWEIQQEIMAYWHGFQCYYHNRTDGNGGPYIWSHEYPHPEQWVAAGNVNYAHKHNEAYADAFVAAFAPTLWGAKGPNTRFSHWPVDFAVSPPVTHYDKIRDLTLKETIMPFSDVPETHPHYEGIMWASGLGIITGYPDATFKPDLKVTVTDAAGNPLTTPKVSVSGVVTRGQFATMLKRYHDQP